MHQDSLTAHPSLSLKQDGSFSSRLQISFFSRMILLLQESLLSIYITESYSHHYYLFNFNNTYIARFIAPIIPLLFVFYYLEISVLNQLSFDKVFPQVFSSDKYTGRILFKCLHFLKCLFCPDK